MSTLFVFPGQGAQRPGMLHDLPGDRVVRDTVDEASEALGLDVLGLDSAPALRSTVAAQQCLLVAGVALARHLEAQAGRPDAVAGFSIGAFAAAVTASVLSLRDAVRLVDRRARLMESAFPAGYGMLAVIGLGQRALEALIARVHAPRSPVYLANLNAPTQFVAAGAEPALARLAELAGSQGATGTRAIAISVPSHCELLADAAAALAQALGTVALQPPRLRCYSASLARALREPQRIAADLVQNMARPVRWHETTLLAAEQGVGLFVEMAPGHALTRLAAAALPDALAVAAAETRLDTIAALMAREAGRDR